MNGINSVIIEGNLVRDPDVRATPKGSDVCNFTIASNRFYKIDGQNQEETSYLDIETWAKLAQNCGEYLSKGRGVRVVGRLKQDRWNDPEGKVRSKVKIVAEHVQFMERKKPQDEADEEAVEAVENELVDVEEREKEPVF